MEETKSRVLRLAKGVAREQGVELFDVELLGRGKLLLRVVIDREGGVTLDDCERFSRGLEALMDVEDPIPVPYTLEVSSPGIDRPLRGLEDFEKHKGRLARIVTAEKMEGRNLFIGRLSEVGSDYIKLLVNGKEIDIPLDRIREARLEVELQ